MKNINVTQKHKIWFLQKCIKISKGKKDKLFECLKALKQKYDLEHEIYSCDYRDYETVKTQNSAKIERLNQILKHLLPDIKYQFDYMIKESTKKAYRPCQKAY